MSRPDMNELQEKWNATTTFIRDCKRLHEGTLNALDEMDRLIREQIDDMSLQQIQTAMFKWIDSFIENKIVFAHDQMQNYGIELLSKTRENTIMTIGYNYVLEQIFTKAHERGYNITVIVVDTCPSFQGRE